ncbi:acyl carrier protein [Gordonia sp. VNQ95]|jgi:acyl carrier protein|uniref:acyl carrier protein n=1 Tax=Gordonia TaxID=2053 RepID=UPI0032B3BAD0
MSGVSAGVREVIAAMVPPSGAAVGAEDLLGTARLREDLGFESIRLIELTMVLERRFALAAIPPEELAGVRTVDDVIAVITRAVEAGAA